MNRIRIPNKWDDESVAEAVPERHLAIEKRWKHPSRAKTTSVCGRQCSSVQHAAVKDSEPDGAGVSSGCR